MLKSLRVSKPGELWRIGDKDRCCNWGGYTQGDEGDLVLFSWEAYKHFRAHTPEFAELTALQAATLGSVIAVIFLEASLTFCRSITASISFSFYKVVNDHFLCKLVKVA